MPTIFSQSMDLGRGERKQVSEDESRIFCKRRKSGLDICPLFTVSKVFGSFPCVVANLRGLTKRGRRKSQPASLKRFDFKLAPLWRLYPINLGPTNCMPCVAHAHNTNAKNHFTDQHPFDAGRQAGPMVYPLEPLLNQSNIRLLVSLLLGGFIYSFSDR